MSNENILFSDKGYISKNLKSIFGSEIRDIMECSESSPEHCWTYIFKNTIAQKDLSYLASADEIEEAFTRCIEDYSNNRFSFFFRRLLNKDIENVVSCEASTIAFDFCNSEKFKELITSLTDRKIGNIDVFYINRFDKGHFLNTHTDSGNNVGIALNITQNWDPNFGGLTHVLDKERKKVIETLTPDFGELFLFDTSETQVPHFVSMVTANKKNRRMSIIARYGKV